jgi:16S rRNA (guanine1207-N2)-methyltransferase
MQPSPPSTLRLGDGKAVTTLRSGAIQFQGPKALLDPYRLLIDGWPKKDPERVLLGRDPAGILAMGARSLWPDAAVSSHFLDAYEAEVAGANLLANEIERVEVILSKDLPAGPFDLISFPCPTRGEALLSREFLEQAQMALLPEGRLMVSTDGNPSWLRKAVKEIFGSEDLQVWDKKRGGVVVSRRRKESLRTPDHSHVLKISVEEIALDVRTRPGVFCYGRLDRGTAALLQRLDIEPGHRVLDLGCGTGILGLAAARRTNPEGVVLVDSNIRATALASENVVLNKLDGVTVALRADLEDVPNGPFDRVLANPHYFAKGRIADSFTRAASSHLAPNGVYQMVAKAIEVHREILSQWFTTVAVDELDGYGIFTCRGPKTQE